MRPFRLIALSLIAVTSSMALARSENSSSLPIASSKLTGLQAGTVTGAASSILGGPSLGVRIGGGQWNEFVLDGGIDVTIKLPLLPLPELRFDAEAWTKAANYNDRHGNALSVIGLQTFLMGYAGVGPCYYFTDDNGSHRSGFGAKALAGLNLPDRAFVEASVILGASPMPVFVSVGKRF